MMTMRRSLVHLGSVRLPDSWVRIVAVLGNPTHDPTIQRFSVLVLLASEDSSASETQPKCTAALFIMI